VTVDFQAIGDVIVWSNFWATCRPAGAPGPRPYEELGPFEFPKAQYKHALAAPTHKPVPVREHHDTDALAAGAPAEPAQWLNQMTMAFGRDFLTPHEPETTTAIVLAGLRALRASGTPVTDDAVRTWAQGRRFSDEAVERYVEWSRQLPL
jgi:hypothetical protein